jgi:hypothetical protein
MLKRSFTFILFLVSWCLAGRVAFPQQNPLYNDVYLQSINKSWQAPCGQFGTPTQQIQSALVALPSTGGTLDLSCYTSPITLTQDVFSPVTEPVTVILPAVTVYLAANTTIPSNFQICPRAGSLLSVITGALTNSTFNAGGNNYQPGDTGNVAGTCAGTTYQILTAPGGVVGTYLITAPGSSCTIANGVSTTAGGSQPGIGAGFKVNITATGYTLTNNSSACNGGGVVLTGPKGLAAVSAAGQVIYSPTAKVTTDYASSSSTGGIQEAITAAGTGGKVIAPPGTYTLSAGLTVHASNIDIAGEGATLICNAAAPCAFLGTTSPNAYSNIRFHGFIFAPGTGSSTYPALEDDAQKSVIDISFATNASNTFGYLVENDDDQSEDLRMYLNAAILTCNSTSCGSALYSPSGAAYAGITWIHNSLLDPECQGNSIDWQNYQNPFTSKDNIFQGYSEFAVRIISSSGTFEGDNHFERGSCTNPLNDGNGHALGGAGLLLVNASAEVHGVAPYGGDATVFATNSAGSTAYQYYVVVHQTSSPWVSMPLPIGYLTNGPASISGAAEVFTLWPAFSTAASYDLLRESNGSQAPYGTGLYAVATGLLPGTVCGANGVCSYTDNVTTLSSYITPLGNGAVDLYAPYTLFFPGDLVLLNNAAETHNYLNVGVYKGPSVAGGTVVNSAGADMTLTHVVYNPGTVGRYSAELLPTMQTYAFAPGAYDTSGGNIFPMLLPDYSGSSYYQKKGLVNLGSTADAGPTDDVTIYDSNYLKTLATSALRPSWDAGDAAICKDGSTAGAGLCERAATSVSTYINSLPDGMSWAQRTYSTGQASSVSYFGMKSTAVGTPASVSVADVISTTVWQASHNYLLTPFPVNRPIIYDGANWEELVWPGTSGATAPTWSVTPGQQTVDGTVTWVCLGTSSIAANTTYYIKVAASTPAGSSIPTSELTVTTANDANLHLIKVTESNSNPTKGATAYQTGCSTTTGTETIISPPYTGAYNTGPYAYFPILTCTGSGSMNTVDHTGDAVVPSVTDTTLAGSGTVCVHTNNLGQLLPTGGDCSTGGSSLFTSFQFGSNTAMTGSGIYFQLTYGTGLMSSYSGSGTSGSPFIGTLNVASATQYGLEYGTGSAGPPNVITPPATAGLYFNVYNPTTSAAVAPTAVLSTSLPAGSAIGSLDIGTPQMSFATDLVSFNQPISTGPGVDMKCTTAAAPISGDVGFTPPSSCAATYGHFNLPVLPTSAGIFHAAAASTNVSAVTIGAVSLSADVSGILPGTNGGTGENNGAFTISLAGNLATTGAYNATFALGGTATFTMPITDQTIPGIGQANIWSAHQSFSALLTGSANGGSSSSTYQWTGLPYGAPGNTGGSPTGTTATPLMYFNSGASAPSTWSTSGTYLGFNAVASFVGNFFDFHVNGGASVAKLDYAGNLTVASCTGCGATSGVFTSYQFGSNTAITGTGNYFQLTYDSSLTSTYTGAGSSGSPYIATLKLASVTQYGLEYGTGSAGAPNVVTPPATAGLYFNVYNPTTSAAVAPTALLSTSLPVGTVIGSLDSGTPQITFATNLISFNQPIATTGATSGVQMKCQTAAAVISGDVGFTPPSSCAATYGQYNLPVLPASAGIFHVGAASSNISAVTVSLVVGADFGSSIAGGTLFGNNTGSAAAPGFTAAPVLGIAGSSAGSLGLCPGTGSYCITLGATNSTGSGVVFNFPTSNGTNNYVLKTDGSGNTSWTAAGTGTVTTFSAGTLSPLFTTSVATASSTPALSFTLSNAAGGTLFGNNTGSSAAPGFTAAPVLGIAGSSAGSLVLCPGTGSYCITLEATNSTGASTIFAFPTGNGSSTNVLTTDGAGHTSWTSAGAGTVTVVSSGNLTANLPVVGGGSQTEATLAIAPTSITTSCSGANVVNAASAYQASWTVTTTGSCALEFNNLVSGGFYTVMVTQGSGGSHTLALTTGDSCTAFHVSGAGAGAVTPTTTVGAIDVMTIFYDGTNCEVNYNKNFT